MDSGRLKTTRVPKMHREHSAQRSLFSEHLYATGIALGLFALVPHSFLSPEMSLAFAAILLGIVAGVYFGFAVMKGSNFQQQVEFNVTGLFGTAALLGIGVSPWFIPAAYLAHAVWDAAHHNRAKLGSYLSRNGTFPGARSSMALSASA